MSTSEFSTIITKTLIFKQLNPPTTIYHKIFNMYITKFKFPGPSNTNMERLQEVIRYDNIGNIVFNKWFYKRPPKSYLLRHNNK